MKKKSICIAILMLLVLCLSVFASCKNKTITNEPNVGIENSVSENVKSYASIGYYDINNPSDVKIAFETKKIQKVSYKYRVLGSGEYSFGNNTLTIKKGVFANETAGDKVLRVFVDDTYTEITLRVVTKVIYTPADFSSIRNDLNGVYILGADIDFQGAAFWPIGKAVTANGKTGTFEGIFDGMGHSISNLTIQAHDWGEGEDGSGQGPSLGSQAGNGRNYSNGIFMSTGGSAQILNTGFYNITVNGQGLNAVVAGSNGGLIKNCSVTCTLSHHGYYEKSAGIAGVNGSGDAAGKIENCIVVYSSGGGSRGIADWNPGGIIRNCYAAVADDYVLHVGYDPETGKVPDDFDYDEWVNQDNYSKLFGNYTIPAFPGSMDTSQGIFYKGGDIINSDVVRKEFLLDPANFPAENGWDTSIWNFAYGVFPTLKVQSR